MKTRDNPGQETDMADTNHSYQFSPKIKTATFVMMAIGLIALVAGYIMYGEDHHVRWWSNLLVNGFFYFAIALGALFFYTLQYAAEVAWSAQLKRIFEALFSYIKWGWIPLVIVFIGASLHMNHIYHWMDEGTFAPFVEEATIGTEHPHYVHDKELVEAGIVVNPDFDTLIEWKRPFLNQGFWWARTIVYLGVFIFAAYWFRKTSLEEDRVGGTRLHYLQFKRAALFLVGFGVFSSTLSWDWLMSIDVHWFSTLYGWYVFSGMWVTCLISAVVLTLYLRSRGYLSQVNESHIHDLGKWMFAISMLWSYLWFSQFMLIWYSNIPEEVTYFVIRLFTTYKIPFLLTFFINFALPFFILIARDAKRNPVFLIGVGMLIFIGHFMDVYLLIIPGTMFDHNHFGFFEIGMFVGFLGLFIYVVMDSLTKAPLIAQNHPFLEESKHHAI